MQIIWCIVVLSVAWLIPGQAWAQRNRTPVDPRFDDLKQLKWKERAPGVWSARIGKKAPVTYLDYAAAVPAADSLARLPSSAFPLNKARVRGRAGSLRSFVSVPLDPGEKLFGFGLQFRGLNRRGRVYHLRTDHYKSGNERLHAPVPFYISSKGYGVLFNTPQFISVYAGVGNRRDSPNFPIVRDRNTDRRWQARPDSDAVEASVAAPGMEVVVFEGPSLLDVVRRYNLFCGGGCLPPRWGLGFWHRMRTHADAAEVVREVDDFAIRGFPLSVIGLEPGWHSKSYPCTYEWNPDLFPDPSSFMNTMTGKGIQINLWENPYVSPEAKIYKSILPYTGSHTVWLGVVPDFTLAAARNIVRKQHESEHLTLGVSGYKIDEVDGYDFWLWPDHAEFPSGTSAEVMRQTYALQLQQMLMGMFRDRNQRTYSLIRASNAGASGYPFSIYTDHYEHRGFVTALVNSGLAGVLYTPEIRSAGTPEEWLRRMQSVCFSPMMQLNGWASNTKPWSFPKVEDEVRDVMRLRTRLLPYVYTAFARYHFEGIPPIRPMILEPGYLDAPGAAGAVDSAYAAAVGKDVTDQYMFGDCLLVAPMFVGEESRTVILPKGPWYDFYTGERVGDREIITVQPSLDKIPLFVRNGGVVPMLISADYIPAATAKADLELRCYGPKGGETQLYDDDGTTFDFERGEYRWTRLVAKTDAAGKLNGESTAIAGEFAGTHGELKWRFMSGL